MARLDLRLSDDEKRQITADAASEGVSVSELVRRRVLGQEGTVDRLEDVERRLARLEELAGL